MLTKKTDKIVPRLMLSTVIFTLVSSAAHAQLEEVIVTAQKRSQDVQRVPITVDAFTAKDLRQSNINTVNDLQKISPSLFVYTTTAGASDTTVKIRGVGTTGNNPGLEGAVGTFIDGVYRNRSGLALGDLFDVQRIEVLEGPQSTLFGKNTSAGALSIITNSPDQSHDAMLQATATNYAGYKLEGYINVPISEELSTRWDALYDKQNGFITDLNSGKKINSRNRYYIKGQALWTPNDDVSLRVIADYSNGNERCCGAIRVVNGATAPIINQLAANNGSAPSVPSRTKYHTSMNGGAAGDFPLHFQDMGGSAELNWQLFPSVKLTNIVGYRNFMQSNSGDFDFTGADIFRINGADFKDDVASEEFRLSGHVNFGSLFQLGDLPLFESMDWMGGFYYTNEHINVNANYRNASQTGNYWCAVFVGQLPAALQALYMNQCFAGSAANNTLPVVFLPGPPLTPVPTLDFNLFQPNTGDSEHFSQNGNSWSAFGQATMHVTDKLAVTGGLRYSEDYKHGGSSFVNNNPTQSAPPGYYNFPFWIGLVHDWHQRTAAHALTGTASVQYFWTDQVMTYASWSRGYKSGGFNLDRTAGGIVSYAPTLLDPAYKPEFSTDIETGLKSKWWDNKLLVNATIFTETFYDLQVLNFDGVNFHIFNVPKGTSQGFEVQSQVTPLPGLALSGSVTYADTRYDSGSFLPTQDIFGNVTNVSLFGKHFTNSPVWSTSEGATYTFPLLDTGYTGIVHGDLFYGSSRNTGSDLNPVKEQAGYTLYNARITLMNPSDSWELAAFCSNCTNKKYLTVVFDSVGQNVPGLPGSYDSFVGDPAIYGLTATLRF
ncbi:MAG: TonB-dependent receptor [Alphaproteobacteria bacterium]|nr:TonB-dependent receptor [Alphaproteobacteria bacterium]MDE2013053.1 TonB-dependent receptor [Alphaproteobacteria bacterium]MDE2073913.1 TonB-dependent receptor [Alphaproteobacteria bacterium]MDE2352012.1 TonB-dependent receptor [Alphaproteobacteria bacterium]